jgi:hypothetical protein
MTDKAFSLYLEIEKNKDIVLDEIFYNTLLDGLLKNNDIEK